MNRIACLVLLLPLLALLDTGCALVASETVYVQNATVTAPAGHLPVRTAQDVRPGVLTVSPSIAVGPRTTTDAKVPTHSPVNPAGVYAVDTLTDSGGRVSFRPGNNALQYVGTNMHWNTPAFTAMLSLDYTLSKSLALEGGICYASNTGADIWGGHVGLGLMSEGDVFGFRLSGGIQWTPIYYSVETAVVTQYEYMFSSSRETIVAFYRDQGKDAPFGWYAGFTLNTRLPEWPIQTFVNITLSKERFFSYQPSNYFAFGTTDAYQNSSVDSRAEASAVLVLLSPGVSIPVGPSQRVLIGARWSFAPDMMNEDGSSMPTQSWFAPFIQVDIGL
ncbi:MAG: hypothetical protein WB699_11555 [Bacteroidota bacterium]